MALALDVGWGKIPKWKWPNSKVNSKFGSTGYFYVGFVPQTGDGQAIFRFPPFLNSILPAIISNPNIFPPLLTAHTYRLEPTTLKRYHYLSLLSKHQLLDEPVATRLLALRSLSPQVERFECRVAHDTSSVISQASQ